MRWVLAGLGLAVLVTVARSLDGPGGAAGEAATTDPASPADLRRLHTLRSFGHVATGAAFSPDGAYSAVGRDRDGIVLRETASGRERVLAGDLLPHTDPLVDLAFSADGARLASAGGDGLVRLWETTSGRALGALVTPDRRTATTLAAWRVAFPPDGATLAVGYADGTTRLWDVGRGRELATVGGHHGAVEGLAFSADRANPARGCRGRVPHLRRDAAACRAAQDAGA